MERQIFGVAQVLPGTPDPPANDAASLPANPCFTYIRDRLSGGSLASHAAIPLKHRGY
jgi:hypothetical protein